MKYHIVTLGCQMNMSDAERTRSVLEGMGYVWTDREEEATLLGILACSVRQRAIDKVYSRIQKWNRIKNNRNLLTFVTGCILPSDREKFLKLFDIVFPMSELGELPPMIRQYGIVTPFNTGGGLPDSLPILKNEAALLKLNEHIPEFWQIRPEYASDFEAFVPIQNGCDKFCTFCAVPYTRGREVSRSSQDILEEIHHLVEGGYKSITLLGQNVNSYGRDKKGAELDFSALLRKIGQAGIGSGKEFLVYFTSPHPRDMTEEVIRIIAEYPNLARQIHLPLQSGDDAVLKRMNRKHSMGQYREIVGYMRKHLPDATLFTDIIVGFTGETEDEFENTRRAMDEFRFNMAYIAQYSRRPGAVSAQWADDVPPDVKKLRYHNLTNDLMNISLAHNKQMTGKVFRVLVRGLERKGNFLSGLTEGRINVRIFSSDTSFIGQFADVWITAATDFSVAGDIVLPGETTFG